MNANLTRGPWRRRSRLFLGSPARSAASELPSAAVAAPRVPPSSNPSGPWSARPRSTQVRSADSVRSNSRATCATDLPSSSTNPTAPALNSSVNCRRGLRGLSVAAIVDIVSAFPRVSTKPDQAHSPGPAGELSHLPVQGPRRPVRPAPGRAEVLLRGHGTASERVAAADRVSRGAGAQASARPQRPGSSTVCGGPSRRP